MTYYDVYVAVPKDPAYDWRESSEGLWNLSLRVRVAWGLNAVLAVPRAIDAGELEGRQADWGSWIAPVSRRQAIAFIEAHGWQHPAELDALPEDGLFLVAMET